MKPIDEQTILITGSTDGLGRAAARKLASRGATLLVHGRSRERLEATVAEIGKASRGKPVRGYLADLAELAQVRRLAAEVAKDYDRLDLLINNAGIIGGRGARRETSADGYERTFAVNYLAPFLLTRLLLPLLRRAAPSRVVNVTSVGQSPIDFADVMLERGYEPMRAYTQSKLAQIMHAIDLAAELEGHRITVNAMHPASLMSTKMVMESFGHATSTVEEGVEALLYVATSPALDGVTGRYFNQKREARALAQAYDPKARTALKTLSERLTGLAP